MAGRVGRPSVNEAVTKRRVGRLAWDAKTAERVDVIRLLDRLQANALGEYQNLKDAIPAFLKRLGPVVGFDPAMSPQMAKQAFDVVLDFLGRIQMDTAAVKSAEIVLRKVLPDLAQIEQKNTTNNLHVVMMPQQASSSADWADQNRIVHEQRTLEPAARTPNGASVLPGS